MWMTLPRHPPDEGVQLRVGQLALDESHEAVGVGGAPDPPLGDLGRVPRLQVGLAVKVGGHDVALGGDSIIKLMATIF